jgi:hypothetical protein
MGTTYFGWGDKAAIMAYFYNAILGLTPTPYVDYQRSYSSSSGPGKEPGAFINDILETKQQILVDVVKNNLTVGVVGWVRASNNENLWDKINTFAKAIQVAIRNDPSLGNQALETVVTRVETDSGSRYPVGVFIIVFTVTYFSRE